MDISQTRRGCLFTVVNPSQSVQETRLPDTPFSGEFVLYHDNGFEPVIKDSTIRLGAEQLAVVGFGKYAVGQSEWKCDKDIHIPQKIKPLKGEMEITGNMLFPFRLTPRPE